MIYIVHSTETYFFCLTVSLHILLDIIIIFKLADINKTWHQRCSWRFYYFETQSNQQCLVTRADKSTN
jgi:hypothetical protein